MNRLLFGVLLAIASVLCFAGVDPASGWEEGGGIEWHQDGGFNLGMEIQTQTTNADLTQPILMNETLQPMYPKLLKFVGTVAFEPPNARQFSDCWFICAQQLEYVRTADLVRVSITGCWKDPQTGALGRVSHAVVNVDQHRHVDGETVYVSSIEGGWHLPQSCEDGTPLQIRVKADLSGIRDKEAGVEINLAGEWQ